MRIRHKTMRAKPVALAVALTFAFAAPLTHATSSVTTGNAASSRAASAQDQPRSPFIIVLREPALASHTGSVRFAKAPRIKTGARSGRLDVHSVHAREYVNYLREQQVNFVAQISAEANRPLKTLFTSQYAINAIGVELTAAEAAWISARADVALVDADRDVPFTNAEPGPSFIGADQIWNGSASGGLATQGEGMVLGIIDSGINWASPSFAALDPVDGYQHINPLGAGQYLGTCSALDPSAPDIGRCNDKLIGMYNFSGHRLDGMDTVGHGSHTASTAVGNHRVVNVGGNLSIAGIAPRANVVAFNCTTDTGGCGYSGTMQAIEQAVADGVVDVLNYSVSGGTHPWAEPISLAFLGATEAGIFVAAAAGNEGPTDGSVNHREPWTTTVGASTYDHAAAMRFTLRVDGVEPPSLQKIGVHPGGNTNIGTEVTDLPIALSPTFSNQTSDGCEAFPPGTFVRNGIGAIAVLSLNMATFTCGTSMRKINATGAGAAAVLFVENTESFLYVGAEGNVWTMQMSDWLSVWNVVQNAPNSALASISLPMAMYPQRGDRIPAFSSRGPAKPGLLSNELFLKPDLVAPGLDVLAAEHSTPDAVAYMNGTSMAAPHVSGAALLLRAVHPQWTPMELKSALVSSAWSTGILADTNLPVTPFVYGAGRLDVAAAARAGLVLDETGTRMRESNPAQGGVLNQLNLPNGLIAVCSIDACTLTRRVRSTLDHAVEWDSSGTTMPGARVTPERFTLAPGASQDIAITVNPATISGTWGFGEIELKPNDVNVAIARLPWAIGRDQGRPMLVISSFSLAATTQADTSTTRPLILSNGGSGSAVRWSVNTTESGCEQPTWASFSPLSGTLLAGGAARTLTTTFNAQGLAAGEYNGVLCLTSDDSSVPLTRIDLNLRVLSTDVIFAHGFES